MQMSELVELSPSS
ncbi:hypothetical protein F383_36513 [Gossypium arboreum]|uniref:Uncharacterized protein n=1 Tax=Gossypium arboreum TaxID=29729 RepID=A0A0B0Q2U4_GOSAR|nr:hypothetical protein F383_36513 [Gossypium arboreum]